ncbi:U3 small nucleolar ribonucleoprotein protein MPP10 [Rhodamnia argentea]|uniref:U3 small nucleolar ribonucleoprotein protein MPP10 n=1 Tax=Rhodamnia argentea TaxID=178133 RepID=A0A8B8NI16_9MYRT|nr:U3 small nucleolar ribonucleoprotein protein MPP10 [Rhodamnia argentea]
MVNPEEAGLQVLHRLKSTDPPIWLAPNPSLSQETRAASLHLFSSLKPFSPKSPFDHLLVDGFDAEQIWQQIDLQSQPLLSSLRRELRRFEKDPGEISNLFGDGEASEGKGKGRGGGGGDVKESQRGNIDDLGGVGMEVDGFDEIDEDGDSDEEEDGEEEGVEDRGVEGGESEEGEEERNDGGIEDKFLKIKELEEYLREDEAREYGLEDATKKNKKEKKVVTSDSDEEEEEEEEEEEGDDDELGEFDVDDEDDEGKDKLGIRYEDFFGAKKKKVTQRKPKSSDELGYSTDDDEEEENGADGNKGNHNLSTHEKELLDLKAKIEQMEKSNLEPKTWTMQGEVTAAKRPKNSALEVDLDFEHNARPAPVITEEVTASLEELIRSRIREGHFDDVEKPPSLPTKGPREIKQLDENKSKRGLAEIYEEEYAQRTSLASAPLSFSDELKKEASLLFKKVSLKLDALSHFHFAPKPIIEDMSIQANVPALAMEEIAPLAVSDAAMLAPEEVFAGKGDLKDETELTQAERKRRRAKKKRIHKTAATKRMAKKGRETAANRSEGKEE